MTDYSEWQHGGARYPLPASTANSLLEDADPALFQMLAFVAAVLEEHIAARLSAEGDKVNLKIANAVRSQLTVEPSQYMSIETAHFPLFALYRRTETDTGLTVSYEADVADWEYAYVLPRMEPRQIAALNPILRSASRAIAHAVNRGWDKSYRSGENVWVAAGLVKAKHISARYGAYPAIDDIDGLYRAVTGVIRITEREQWLAQSFENFEGADAELDVAAADGTAVQNVVDFETDRGPSIENIDPTDGSAAGGELVTLTGDGFRVGTRPRVILGGADASGVTVVSATEITCLTPPHEAFPTFVADVTVISTDGQSATLQQAFTFTA